MIDINKISQLAETIEIDETIEGLSAYGVWKAAKDVFAQLNLEFTETSQKFYNAAKNGSINGVKSSTQKFSDEDAEKYIAKLVAKAMR
jgi:hypothetical protein